MKLKNFTEVKKLIGLRNTFEKYLETKDMPIELYGEIDDLLGDEIDKLATKEAMEKIKAILREDFEKQINVIERKLKELGVEIE